MIPLRSNMTLIQCPAQTFLCTTTPLVSQSHSQLISNLLWAPETFRAHLPTQMPGPLEKVALKFSLCLTTRPPHLSDVATHSLVQGRPPPSPSGGQGNALYPMSIQPDQGGPEQKKSEHTSALLPHSANFLNPWAWKVAFYFLFVLTQAFPTWGEINSVI